jgi:hypothetical protein
MAVEYHDWLRERRASAEAVGIHGAKLPPNLFPHQDRLVRWALSRGRAAIFADTGLGKTAMQVSWADAVCASSGGRVLILAPLAVAQQTVDEAAKFGVDVVYAREDSGSRIVITNYEMMDRFNPRDFVGVALDESSILKSFTGKTRNALIDSFADTTYRLACTATPSPNDHTELGNHSEFLGIKTRVEMLAEYFVHDGGSTQDWRIKGHARDSFWDWVCSWGAVVSKPSDLGFADDGYDLPPVSHETIDIDVDHEASRTDGLFADDVRTLNDQRRLRRETMGQRVSRIAEHVESHDRPAIIWCTLNAESDALRRAIEDAEEVQGSDSPEDKARKLLGFARGEIRVLVTKPSIAGFGMNWQHCRDVYFTGPSHSYEQTYQAIRRCWRFGQTGAVTVRTCVAETERAVVANMARKVERADDMKTAMSAAMERAKHIVLGETSEREWNDYDAQTKMEVPGWLRL